MFVIGMFILVCMVIGVLGLIVGETLFVVCAESCQIVYHETMRGTIKLPILDGDPVSLSSLAAYDSTEVEDPIETFLADLWFQEEEFVAWGQEPVKVFTGISEIDWVRALNMAEAKEEAYQLLEHEALTGCNSW